eukprot:452104-Rhodomonas_salina.1
MSGADIGYAATTRCILCGTGVGYAATWRSVMCGTDIGYAATRPYRSFRSLLSPTGHVRSSEIKRLTPPFSTLCTRIAFDITLSLSVHRVQGLYPTSCLQYTLYRDCASCRRAAHALT